MATKQRLLRFCMLIKRHPDMSVEEFNDYWTNTHGPIVKEWLKRHGVVRYTQVDTSEIKYHTPKEMRDLSNEVWGELGGSNQLDFDGHVELLVPDVQCLKNALADPYYKDVVLGDEAKFLDPPNCSRTVGWEEVYVQDGQVQPTPNVIKG